MGASEKVSVNPSRLRAFTPIGELTHAAFRDLVAQTVVRSVAPGTKLFEQGDEDDWTHYLLEGSVELTAQGGFTAVVHAGTSAAEMPLAPHQPRRETARTLTPCLLARVPSSLLEVLLRPAGPSAVELTEIGEVDDALEHRLLCQIFEDYVADKLTLPSLPEVALRIRKAVGDAGISAAAVEKIVTADPAVAARLIQVANSAAFAGMAPTESCRDAVTRLGLPATRDLVTSLLLKQLFHTRSPLLAKRMYELWQHSTRVAAICFHLAKLKPGFNPDRALLAGLVHDIGVLPILSRAEEYPELCDDPEQLAFTIAKLRGQFGAMVLRRWNFPSDMVTTALEAEDWQRDPKPSADYCDLVLLSQLFSFVGTPQLASYPTISKLPAFNKLALGELNAEKTLDVLDQAQETIDDLQRMLSGGSDR